MLNENQVVKITCKYLESEGYFIKQSLSTKDRGYDIIAIGGDGKVLIIEAKGATSSNPDSVRFDKGFNRGQVNHHVAMALYAAAKTISENPECETGMALHYNEHHITAIEKIHNVLGFLSIKIYWVLEDGSVFVNQERIKKKAL
ncbi:hypothetical protein [Clostridium sp. HBUAS56010]|uniref:hypothetical protein n=1 Tax=Clostridium sp. HBUAS56010 TaxID=2571127 RepID=UPI0011783E56|nr:hypothetical protein [Clostridium sp. HBUAS56010]